MLTVVTSFNKKGYESYGERFIKSFTEHWDSSIHLVVYTEGVDIIDYPGVISIDLFSAIEECKKFHDLFNGDDLASGKHIHRPRAWKQKDVQSGYSFRYDSVKFSKKVFAIKAAKDIVGEGKLFWVDADVVTFNDITTEVLHSFLPDGEKISYLGRESAHSECGFVGYDLDDPIVRMFIDRFAELYSSHEVFNIPEWHDSFVFDWLRRKMNISGFNLSRTDKGHVFINSALGGYMDHLKGDRKGLSRSERTSVSVNHNHKYWGG